MTEPVLSRMPLPARWRRPALAFALTLAACLGGESLARAETVADVAGPANAVLARLEERKAALARAGAAVVGIEVRALDDARSSATLGRRRAGSGVVIGSDGLVLTIGYLILEADRVDLVDSHGRHLPARVVAYDLASGLRPAAGARAAAAGAGAARRLGLGQGRRAAADRQRRQRRRPQPGAHGVAPAVLRLLGIPHRRRPLHRAGAHRPQRRRRCSTPTASWSASARWSSPTPPATRACRVRGNMFVPVDLLKPILAEMRSSRQRRAPAPGPGSASTASSTTAMCA